MNGQKFRKHPGGIKSIVSTFKILFFLGIVVSAVAVVAALVALFNNEVSMYVVTNNPNLNSITENGFSLTNLKSIGLIHFEARNVFEWLWLPRYNGLDFYTHLISFLITWQLYHIFSEINMDNPFYEGILKRINLIYRFIFIGFVFITVRHFYIVYVIKNIGDGNFNLPSSVYESTPGYLSLGTWLIVYLFAHVYKKGVLLQREQDLTI